MPYDALETQRLFRQVENGQFRMLPGGELVERLYQQLKVADVEIKELEKEASVPVARVPRRRRTEIEPAAESALAPTQAAPAAPIRMEFEKPRVQGEYRNPFMLGSHQEASAPIPFKDTADPGVDPPKAPVSQPIVGPDAVRPARRARAPKLK